MTATQHYFLVKHTKRHKVHPNVFFCIFYFKPFFIRYQILVMVHLVPITFILRFFFHNSDDLIGTKITEKECCLFSPPSEFWHYSYCLIENTWFIKLFGSFRIKLKSRRKFFVWTFDVIGFEMNFFDENICDKNHQRRTKRQKTNITYICADSTTQISLKLSENNSDAFNMVMKCFYGRWSFNKFFCTCDITSNEVLKPMRIHTKKLLLLFICRESSVHSDYTIIPSIYLDVETIHLLLSGNLLGVDKALETVYAFTMNFQHKNRISFSFSFELLLIFHEISSIFFILQEPSLFVDNVWMAVVQKKVFIIIKKIELRKDVIEIEMDSGHVNVLATIGQKRIPSNAYQTT